MIESHFWSNYKVSTVTPFNHSVVGLVRN